MIGVFILLSLVPASAQESSLRGLYQVRYIASGAVYLDGGRDEGLSEGFRLTVKRLKVGEAQLSAPMIGELVVTAVAAHSAVCEVKGKKVDFEVGDIAVLSEEDFETMKLMRSTQTSRKYAQVVSFTDGDPLDEELRDSVPRPRSPEINRFRGRLSYEFSALRDHGPGEIHSDQHAYVFRGDVTRIGGTYWNFTGYYRGRVNARGGGVRTETLIDLMNRTYHVGLYYNNPDSKYTAGIGRLFIPWASSLNTIDGGYLGRRMTRHLTVAAFAGSTPDPTAWNYNPNRQIAGALVNLDAGNFEGLHYSTTAGVAVTRVKWLAERDYAFFENSFSVGRSLSVYHNLEVDHLSQGRLGASRGGVAPSRSFLTFRYQPIRRITLDVNHNYFRGIPTFDSRLLGTGLLDRLLFQGFSGGVRIDLPYRMSWFSSVGENRRAGEAKQSLNQMHGVTFQNLFHTGLRTDVRYSRFTSSFASGSYESITISREVRDRLRLEFQGGRQNFTSALSRQNQAVWINTSLDYFLGRHYMIGAGIMLYRGQVQNYEQIFCNLGYRF